MAHARQPLMVLSRKVKARPARPDPPVGSRQRCSSVSVLPCLRGLPQMAMACMMRGNLDETRRKGSPRSSAGIRIDAFRRLTSHVGATCGRPPGGNAPPHRQQPRRPARLRGRNVPVGDRRSPLHASGLLLRIPDLLVLLPGAGWFSRLRWPAPASTRRAASRRARARVNGDRMDVSRYRVIGRRAWCRCGQSPSKSLVKAAEDGIGWTPWPPAQGVDGLFQAGFLRQGKGRVQRRRIR